MKQVCVVIILIMLFSACSVFQSEEQKLWIACQEAVKSQLKAPTTAIFDGPDVFTNINGTVSMSGTVNAQNSFGAMVRSTVTCVQTPESGPFPRMTASLL